MKGSSSDEVVGFPMAVVRSTICTKITHGEAKRGLSNSRRAEVYDPKDWAAGWEHTMTCAHAVAGALGC
jgi:hypothetical protein